MDKELKDIHFMKTGMPDIVVREVHNLNIIENTLSYDIIHGGVVIHCMVDIAVQGLRITID